MVFYPSHEGVFPCRAVCTWAGVHTITLIQNYLLRSTAHHHQQQGEGERRQRMNQQRVTWSTVIFSSWQAEEPEPMATVNDWQQLASQMLLRAAEGAV